MACSISQMKRIGEMIPGRATACVKTPSPERLGAFEAMEENTVPWSTVNKVGDVMG